MIEPKKLFYLTPNTDELYLGALMNVGVESVNGTIPLIEDVSILNKSTQAIAYLSDILAVSNQWKEFAVVEVKAKGINGELQEVKPGCYILTQDHIYPTYLKLVGVMKPNVVDSVSVTLPAVPTNN